MRNLFNDNELGWIEESAEFLSSEDLSAVLGRPVSSVRVKLTRMGKLFNPNLLKLNQIKDVTIEEDEGKIVINVARFKGALKVVVV